MEQYIYANKLYILGKMSEVIAQIKALSSKYNTVKELIDNTLSKMQKT